MTQDNGGIVGKDFTNLYSVTKTIRFNLLPVENNYKPKQKLSIENFKIEITDFISNYKKVITDFKEIIFTNDGEGNQILNPSIKIKIQWLKNFAKQDFFADSKLSTPKLIKRNNQGIKIGNSVTLRETEFLKEKFENWINKNYFEAQIEDVEEIKFGILEELDKLNKLPLENQSRKADFAYWMHKINHRNNFIFIYELFGNISHQNGGKFDEHITDTFKILKNCKTQLEQIQNYLRPSQSFGLEIEKTSLNYHTVNKKPKNYPEEIRNFEQKIENQYFNQDYFEKKLTKKDKIKSIKIFPNDQQIKAEKNKLQNLLKDIPNYLSLDIQALYKELKNYKAKQKSQFYEYIFEILEKYKEHVDYVFDQSHYDCCIRSFPLFSFSNKETQFEKFVKQSKIIRDLSNNARQNKEKIKLLKEYRGKYFDVQNGTCSFDNYKSICELFKSVAMEYGKIKASIKGIEKEKIEASKLQSWSILIEKKDQCSLVCIPKEKSRKAYYDISNMESNTKGDQSIWLVESLTLRALDKLCFGENSSFRESIEKDIIFVRGNNNYFITEKGKTRLKRIDEFPKINEKIDQNYLVKFYQNILKLESTKSQILIDTFVDGEYIYNPIFDSTINNLNTFRIELEKTCYIKKEIKITQESFDELVNNFGAKVYQITSYDLEKDRKNPEEHTNIWKKFCNLENGSGYKIRLNPEMKISYVEKRIDSVLDKNGNEVKRNRRKQAEFILSTTMSQNNDKPKFDMSFKDKDLIKSKIDVFNKTLNDKLNPNDVWYYGLDRGQEELLTLGLFKFPQKRVEYLSKDENWNKTIIGGNFEVWELKEENLLKTDDIGRIVYKNLSYFIHNENLFEKKIVSCLNLTCAKLVGDKIVINGDISTYLKLKLIAACRKITDGIQNGLFVSDEIQIYKMKNEVTHKEIGDKILSLKVVNKEKEENYNLYFFEPKFLEIISLEKIKTILQEHFNKIKSGNSEEDNYSIEKINHLRDAICANAVGIISKLYETHKGFINFENSNLDHHKKELNKFYGNLGTRIEQVLVNKFKNLGYIPPNYKNYLNLQSEKVINQLGVIVYTNVDSTSGICPNCGQKIDNETKNLNKWGNHRFRCMNNRISCGFNTYSQSEIDKNKAEKNEKNLKNPTATTNYWDFIPDKKSLDFLKSSDDVACYNIAKRGLELISNIKK
jgi:hypothetical protein